MRIYGVLAAVAFICVAQGAHSDSLKIGMVEHLLKANVPVVSNDGLLLASEQSLRPVISSNAVM
jgi:hypothetical protein